MFLSSLLRIAEVNGMSYWAYMHSAASAGANVRGTYLDPDDGNAYFWSGEGNQPLVKLSPSGEYLGSASFTNGNTAIWDLKKFGTNLVGCGFSGVERFVQFPSNDIFSQSTLLFGFNSGTGARCFGRLSGGDYVGMTDNTVACRVSGSTKVWNLDSPSLSINKKWLSVDSSDNIYLASYYTSGVVRLHIIKFNANGSVLWARHVNTATSSAIAISSAVNPHQHIDIDSSGNLFAVFRYNTDGRIGLLKIDSAGNITTQNSITVDAITGAPPVVKIQGDYVYVAYRQTTSALTVLCCFDLACNLQWSRTISVSGWTSGSANKVCFISTTVDALLIATTLERQINGANAVSQVLLKVPLDGSLTGTYGPISYSVGSISTVAQTHSLSDAACIFSDTRTFSTAGAFDAPIKTGAPISIN